MKKTANYEAICQTLGFRPDSGFVKITNRGTISFTCGKPDEIRSLLYAVRQSGMKPSAALVRAASR